MIAVGVHVDGGRVPPSRWTCVRRGVQIHVPSFVRRRRARSRSRRPASPSPDPPPRSRSGRPGARGRARRTPADQTPKTAEEKIQELDQQIRILARQIEIEKEAADAAKATAPAVAAGAGGFEIRSADSAFRVRIRGYLHADSRYYGDDDDNRGLDTFIVRRARPILEATFFKIFDFRVMSDFGGGTAVVQDAYVDARFSKVFNLRAGKQKPPLGQERLLSATDILFIERALPTALVPNRDVGVQAYGELAPWLAYNLGVFNGVVDGGSGDVDAADSKDVVGRVVFTPFKADTKSPLQTLLFGVGASGGREIGTLAAPALAQIRSGGQLVWFRYRTDGTAPNTTIADGRRSRVTAFGQYYLGQLGLQAEYVAVASRRCGAPRWPTASSRQSWQATGSWVLTGETATGRAIAPRKAFDPSKGAWGAFEIVARANALTVDDARVPGVRQPRSGRAQGDRRRRRPQLVSQSQREDRRRLRAHGVRARRRRRRRSARRARPLHAVPDCLLILPILARRDRAVQLGPSARKGVSIMRRSFLLSSLAAVAALLLPGAAPAAAQGKPVTLLNVSYDPTRELYRRSTPPSPSSGRPRPARRSPSSSRTAAPASRRAR